MAQKAVAVKLKWLGSDVDQASTKAAKKKQHCLDKYTGSARELAESALNDLLLDGAAGTTN